MTTKQMPSDIPRAEQRKPIGQIAEIWRYPVSSLGGEQLQTVDITTTGIVGDRQFGLFETSTGKTASPENDSRWHPALFLMGSIDNTAKTYIHFPNGDAYLVCDPALSAALSQYFGFSVGVGRYNDPDWPAAQQLPLIANRYQPAALHVITSASRDALSKLLSLNDLDDRRFRPNIVLNVEAGPCFLESNWLGSTLHCGELSMLVTESTKRCGMTIIAQPNIAADVEILRTIVRNNGRTFGVYCDVLNTGRLQVGGGMELEAGAFGA
ncbi:MOSC domain-containing protein [Rhizobium oryziradicis]|uniref:MOSC domain-containing protein n=1 Tax=Rhizobium oryziradicis TaxID=1867956 RepID=A0A1Q8ZTK2_9HYPH|nr:MOSC domain-containing protein [Rhizobium oryziradicis]OLP45409.1 hypothetical protein BJF95_19130 [Rhizobium oryziradicis]